MGRVYIFEVPRYCIKQNIIRAPERLTGGKATQLDFVGARAFSTGREAEIFKGLGLMAHAGFPKSALSLLLLMWQTLSLQSILKSPGQIVNMTERWNPSRSFYFPRL